MTNADRFERLADLWWRRIPRATGYLSSYLHVVATDGLYLAVWRRVAAFATPVCVVLGVLIGATHWGYGEIWTFAESAWLLAVIVALGTMSAHLGTAFLLGYAFGDYILLSAPPNIAADAKSSLLALFSHFVQYGLMASVLITIPVLSKYLAGDLATRLAREPRRRVIIVMVGHPSISLFLVFFWMCALPQLIRPCYLWAGSYSMPDAPIKPVQSQTNALIAALGGDAGAWPWLLTVVLVAVLIKMAVLAAIQMDDGLRGTYDRALSETHVDAAPWAQSRRARSLQVVIRAGWVTLLLAGLYNPKSLWQPSLIFVLTLVLGAVRFFSLRLLPSSWTSGLGRIPLFLRLVLLSAILYPLAYFLMSGDSLGTSFTPLVITAAVGLVLFDITSPIKSDREPEANSVTP